MTDNERDNQHLDPVPAGWTVEAWARRLETLADACSELQPSTAAMHRANAAEYRRRERQRNVGDTPPK